MSSSGDLNEPHRIFSNMFRDDRMCIKVDNLEKVIQWETRWQCYHQVKNPVDVIVDHIGRRIMDNIKLIVKEAMEGDRV